MKIAIITLPLISNFGGILQNYALQLALKNLGHEPETIDLDQSPCRIRYAFRFIRALLTQRSKFVKPDTYHRNPAVTSFLSKNIVLTSRVKCYCCNNDLLNYDAYIVGSDQVWRYTNSKYEIYDVYLRFTQGHNCKRIAYAISFGVSKWLYPACVTKKCRTLISNFDAVSVREENAVKLCRENLGYSPIQVLDPTLLHSKDVYQNLCLEIPVHKGVLVSYILDLTDEKKNLVEDIACRLDLSPVYLTEKRSGGYAVEEWLSYFRDADFVVTDSFHGTVFSIVFEKKFFSILNSNRGADRFTSLLKQLGLDNRLLVDYEYESRLGDIDWELVNNRKEIFINYSMNFLSNSLT